MNISTKRCWGKEYSLLGLGLNCNDDVVDLNNIVTYHAAIYSFNQVDLHLRINQDHHIKILIYDNWKNKWNGFRWIIKKRNSHFSIR